LGLYIAQVSDLSSTLKFCKSLSRPTGKLSEPSELLKVDIRDRYSSKCSGKTKSYNRR